ncbi:hypothetical protein JW998_07405 [candidate division KSB1 bacterium]|nr:hypothetical protein [candidate division KSB1 bacterium]
MNLLKDKRDREKPAYEPIYSFSTEKTTPDSQGPGEEPIFAGKQTGLGKTGTILLSLAAILILAMIITYFGFYRNRGGESDAPADAEIAEIDSSREDVQSSTASVDVSKEEKAADETKTEITPPIKRAGDVSTLRIAADLMQKIQAAMGNGQVTTLFIDDGSFSAEVDAGSLADAQKVYAAIKESLPATMTVASSAPLNGTSALIAGTFAPQSVSSGSVLSGSDVDTKLRALAQNANISISSLDITSQSNGQSFVFMKVEGALDNCRLFIDNLSQENFVNVSKLIMMPASSGNFALVLRFYI